MNIDDIFLLIIFGTFVIGALIIYFGLKYQAKFYNINLQTINASKIIEQFPELSGRRNEFLYGVLQDFSNTEVGLIVKDADDREVGKVSRGLGTTVIHTQEGKFKIYVGGWRTVYLRRQIEDSEKIGPVVCKIIGPIFMGRNRYNWGESHVAEMPWYLPWKSIFPIRVNGAEVAKRIVLSRLRIKGNVVVIPTDIPLHIRILTLFRG